MGKSCERCFRYNEDDNNFCQGCGAPLKPSETQEAAPPPVPNAAVPPVPTTEVPPAPPNVTVPPVPPVSTADIPPTPSNDAVPPAPPVPPVQQTCAQDVENNKIMAVLAYFIFFLPLLVCKDSAFGRFHANQSLVLLLAWIVLSIAGGIVPILGWLVAAVGNLALFVLWIMGILNAINGQMKELPLIGNIVLLK